MYTHKVLRSISGPDGIIPAGTLVNASDWKHVEQLIDMNRLMAIDEPIAPIQSEALAQNPAPLSRKRKPEAKGSK